MEVDSSNDAMGEIEQTMEAVSLKLGVSERQPLRQVAGAVTALNVVMTLLGLGMVVASFIANGGTINLAPHLYVHFFIALVFNIFGLLILKRHPQHTVGWLIMLVGFTAALHFLINGYRAFDEDVLVGNPDTMLNLAILLNHIVWWPIQIVPYTLVLLYFPDGKLLSPRWRIVVIITVLGILFGMITGFHPGPVPEWGITEPNPAGIKGSERFLEGLATVYTVLLQSGVLGSLMGVVVRFRRSTGIERVQMKWLVYAVMAAISFLIILYLIYYLSPDKSSSVQLIYIFPSLLVFVVPVTCTIAIVRHRLWDIDILINRTLVYGILTASIVTLYVTMVSGLGILFRSQGNLLISLVATGFVAVLFQPIRERLQSAINHLLYGERDDPAAVLTQLAHHLEAAETPAAILPNLVQTIAHLLKIPYVAIWLPVAADQMEPVAVWGEASDPMQTIPLTYQKEAIGHLVVAPRGPQEQFNRHEQDLLATIAALTATTVRAVQLSDELRRSRQRIVSAREEERRRLRRDLHDGLGPQLASQTLGLEAVAQLMPTNPEKAQALLESLKTQAQDAIQDVRRLIYDLRPPALDDLGLIEALRQSTSRYETGALRFRFDAPATLPELPAAVEMAVYRIAQEGMTNVVRHAEATLCTVRLFCIDAYVIVEVCDNGRGLPPNHHSGVGLQAIKERTTELNGQYTIELLPDGGTLVQARLPLEVYHE